jgi:Outer membrane protein beta-barrel domain
MKLSLLILIACLAMPLAARAAQAPSQGRVIVETAIIWRTDTSLPIGSVKSGTMLELTAQSQRWYEVVVPASLGGRGQRGLIARSQVELLPGSVAPPVRPLRGDTPSTPQPRTRAPAPPQRPVAGRVRPRPMLPGYAAVNGAYQTRTTNFQETATIRINVEDAPFTTAYTVDSGPALDASVGVLITSHVGLGVGFTRYSQPTDAVLTASVPHPFFFNRPRTVAGNVFDLQREELALHAQARYVWPVTPRFRVAGFGGPSFFKVSQDVVTNFTYTESYPYDEATFQSAVTAPTKKYGIGYNAGGDATYFITRRIGAGFSVTYTHATVKVPTAGGRRVEVDAGGVIAGGGVRLRF